MYYVVYITMFIKKTKTNNATYIQITKSYRVGQNVKHKVFLNLGRQETIKAKEIDDLISVLQKFRTKYFA